MKYIIASLVIFGASFTAFATDSAKKSCFDVSGMTCATCSITLKSAVKKLKGVKSVDASVKKKNASVVYNPNLTNESEIKGKIDSVGYKATLRSCEDKKS